MPALELLQQASGGRLTIINDDMLKVDEGKLLEGTPVQDWSGMFNNKIILIHN